MDDNWEMPPQPTVGIVTTVGSYEKFLPDWCRSVRGLQRKPDKVVIAAHNHVAVSAITDKELPQASVIPVETDFQLGHYLNEAITFCNTDWIAWIGVDDRYRPTALNGIDVIDTDIYIFGMKTAQGFTWDGSDIIKAFDHNPAPCGSPFRRWIWEAIPFQPELAPFEDWAFWVGANALGATSRKTGRIDFDYAIHPDQIVPPQQPTATYIRTWAANL